MQLSQPPSALPQPARSARRALNDNRSVPHHPGRHAGRHRPCRARPRAGAPALAMTPLPDVERLALELEVAELRQQLAEAQDMLMETAADAGRGHAENVALRDELARVRADRDAWQIAARVRGRAVA